MKSDKGQTLVMIGLSLIVVGGVILFLGLSQPRIYEGEAVSENMAVASTTAYMPSSAGNNGGYYHSQSNTKSNTGYTVDHGTYTTRQYTSAVKYPININTATAEELQTISGIGEVRAQKIIEYREKIGGYTDVSQIINIYGIGEATYEKVAPYLTI